MEAKELDNYGNDAKNTVSGVTKVVLSTYFEVKKEDEKH